MGYLSDFLEYNSGNECPKSFWTWSALSLLGHISGRKVVYHHGGDWMPITTAIYVGLVGGPGSGKTTAKSEVKRIMVEYFPNYMYSASIQSREDIVLKMAHDNCVINYDIREPSDPTKLIDEYRPFYIIANEFENFLSVDPVRMIAFLVDIFDEQWFSTAFKKDLVQQSFKNPHVSILACGTPDWLMREMKMSLFTGGLGRRLFLICDERGDIVPDPYRPAGWQQKKAQVIEHLKWVEQVQGVIGRSEDGKKWWWDWYFKFKKEEPDDPLIKQFQSTKHIMLIKLASLLVLTEKSEKLVITGDHFAMGLTMIDALAPRIKQLTVGVGKNENAGYAAQIMETVRAANGMIPEKRLHAVVYRHAPGGERAYQEALKFLEDTGEIVKAAIEPKQVNGVINGVRKEYVVTVEAWEKYQKEHSE